MLSTQLRFRDLKAKGIVNNWGTLRDWIINRDFPRGRLLGPNIRTWDEGEVVAWLESRPSESKPVPRRRA
jgi:hypothetical protein